MASMEVMMMLAKEEDLMFLSCLRQNARVQLTKLSKKINMPVSTLFDRLKMHEKNIIIKHTSLFDFAKLGYSIRSTVFLKVNKNDKDELRKYLMAHQNVNSCFRVNQDYDFMVEVLFKDIISLEEFIEKIEEKFKIVRKQSYYIIEDMKREAFMTQQEFIPVM